MAVAAFDEIERALAKFGDGPFFLGQFSQVSNHSSITLNCLSLVFSIYIYMFVSVFNLYW